MIAPLDQTAIDQNVLRVVHYKAAQLVGTYGFSRSDGEDLQQELLADYFVRLRKFDPAKSSCRTFLRRVIQHRVATLLEAQRAACRDYRLLCNSPDCSAEFVGGESVPLGEIVSADDCERRIGRTTLSSRDREELRIDVDNAISLLPAELANVAVLLKSLSTVEVGRQLSLSRSTLYRRLARIRAVFAAAGLRDYLRCSRPRLQSAAGPAGSDRMPVNDERGPNEHSVDSFPLWVLPAPLADFVSEATQSIGCPPDYVAVPMLPVLGAAIGTRRRIQIKGGWREWSIIWSATVGDTGTAKSPAQEKAAEPLVRLQNRLLVEYEDATEALSFVKRAAANSREKVRAQTSTSVAGSARTGDGSTEDSNLHAHVPIPHLHQVFTTDTTLEALNLCLARNPHGIALVRDELTAWVLAMNEYKRGSGADRPHWQSMWNGSQIVVNRKNNEKPIIIPRPFVCVVGGLPPDMLGELCDERGREDGFIHRLLFTFPDPVPRILTDEGIPPETMERYCSVFDKLRALPGILLLPDSIVTLEFPPDVFASFQSWANEHYAEMDSGPVNLRGPWAKLVTYCARLALIIHLARQVCGEAVSRWEVDAESLSRAIALVGYFKSTPAKSIAICMPPWKSARLPVQSNGSTRNREGALACAIS